MSRHRLAADVRDLETQVAELQADVADVLHPLATEHRYALAGRLRDVEDALARLTTRLGALERAVAVLYRERDEDDDAWKRGGP